MTPSTGLLIGLPVLILAFLVCVAGILFFWWLGRTDDRVDAYSDAGLWFVLSGLCGAGALAVVIGSLFGYWPYKTEYHFWKPTSGTVQTVSQRLVSNGDGGMDQRYVVLFTDGRQRSCDDTRCTLVKPGMYLRLKCIRSYQWGGTPGYNCNYVQAK